MDIAAYRDHTHHYRDGTWPKDGCYYCRLLCIDKTERRGRFPPWGYGRAEKELREVDYRPPEWDEDEGRWVWEDPTND